MYKNRNAASSLSYLPDNDRCQIRKFSQVNRSIGVEIFIDINIIFHERKGSKITINQPKHLGVTNYLSLNYFNVMKNQHFSAFAVAAYLIPLTNTIGERLKISSYENLVIELKNSYHELCKQEIQSTQNKIYMFVFTPRMLLKM
ncbi:hypothetical protein BpHYR1_009979 [Brachionus plicatilis]|uniref:Uncharacterized protein n=1 Tax=Brachionus plicatilis TaxID=10195 RepID=A0A3M7RGH0_BRAPC|nr:hypothetical protein BpHYR1_009979 [Brachionus plicatilis]